MTTIRIVDVTDEAAFGLIPPCADPGFDHRSCDYWEDERRGSKAARLSWLSAGPPTSSRGSPTADNPFAPTSRPAFNPFDPRVPGGSAAGGGTERPLNPFSLDDAEPLDNPFAP